MWDCHTTLPQRVDLALNGYLRNWRLRTRPGNSHRQIRKMVKPPWCAVPTRGVEGIVNFKVLFRRHAVKSIPFSRRSHRRNHLCRNPRISANLPTTVARRRQTSEPSLGSIVPDVVRIVSCCRSELQNLGNEPSPATAEYQRALRSMAARKGH